MSDDPTFLEQLRAAVGQGQTVVVLPAPVNPPPPRDSDATLTAALCFSFGLSQGEARLLGRLLQGDSSRSELCTAVSHSYQAMSDNTLKVRICLLRKKLKPFKVKINTFYKQGYALDKPARDRIRELLGERGVDTSAIEQSLVPAARAPP
jgi:hypothetical protein